MQSPDYRRDIDGLRAIAVLSVIGFHARWTWLRGGFLGVDIFFVISGYLISGLIFRALRAGKFSAKEFYVRRINRIFPALILVLLFCLFAGWVILMPDEYKSLGKHTLGGAAFVANVLLWRETGYFDSPTKPLLHLWSLGIEEQFYLLWPWVALIAWRKKWSIALTLIALIVASFAINLWNLRNGNGAAAFYFAGARFFEILAGAALAHFESRKSSSHNSAALSNTASAVAVVLLIISIAVVRETTPWPGWWSLAPVGVSVLLIGPAAGSWINTRILASRLLVGIGLISYPLYLWHWPLMVGAKLINDGPVKLMPMILIIVTTFLLAWITYVAVEIPIRFGAHKRRSAMVLFPVMMGVGVVGLAAHRGIVRPRLFGASVELEKLRKNWVYPSNGGLDNGRLVVDSIAGTTGDAVVFMGDSHIQQYWPRVLELRKSSPSFSTAIFLAYPACIPLPAIKPVVDQWGVVQQCAKFHDLAMDVIRQPRVRAVVITANWGHYLANKSALLTTWNSRPLEETGEVTDSAFRMFSRELRSVTASGKKVYLILSNPEMKAFDPLTMIPSRIPGVVINAPRFAVPRGEVVASRAVSTRLLDRVARESGAVLLDPLTVMCDSSTCPTVWEGKNPVYIDSNHLSASFVRSRATFIDTVLK